MQITGRSRAARVFRAALIALAAIAVVGLGLRTYGSLRLLQSAQRLGQPQVSSVRGWMTLDYVAKSYHVPLPGLLYGLRLPAETPTDTSLKTLADRRGAAPFRYVTEVQQVVAGMLPEAHGGFASGTHEGFLDWVATWLLRYGYLALGLILLLGAIGLPLPNGLSAALAGSLIALGQMHWLIAVGTAITASVIGDAIGFAIGHAIGDRFLRRHGRWIGYTERRREQLAALFDRWGGITVVLTRTLVSSLSSLVNLVAGASGHPPAGFLGFVLIGRVAWTSAYVGLGYLVAGDVEAAAAFLTNLTGLLVSAAVMATLVLYMSKSVGTPNTSA